jgi:TetR/AcrR family transcriptional regulator
MGILERKEREKEMRRQQILDTAERLFLEKGIETTTMEEIAQVCEISRGTLYLYFKAKEEIYIEVILHGTNILYDMMNEAIERENTVERQIQSIGEAYLNFYKLHRNHFMFMLNIDYFGHGKCLEELNYVSQITEKSKQIWTLIVKVLKRGMEEKFFKADIKPMEIAVLFWASSNGLIRLIDHVKYAHHGEFPHSELGVEDNCEKDYFDNLDFELSLNKLWGFISDGIRI